jgi:hypothetical protein
MPTFPQRLTSFYAAKWPPDPVLWSLALNFTSATSSAGQLPNYHTLRYYWHPINNQAFPFTSYTMFY